MTFTATVSAVAPGARGQAVFLVSSVKKLKTRPDPHSSPEQLADQLLGRVMLTNSRDDLFLLVPDINLQEQ